MRKQRDEECARRHAEAAQQAHKRLQASFPCSERHAYLSRKGIPALADMRQDRNGMLLIPVRDSSGRVQSLQYIAPDGTKRFLTGGKVQGGNSLFPARQKNRWHFVRATPPGPAFTLPVHGRSM